eukprot:scaffold34619_cov35-Tisochrysis_lutea.AAC.1
MGHAYEAAASTSLVCEHREYSYPTLSFTRGNGVGPRRPRGARPRARHIRGAGLRSRRGAHARGTSRHLRLR